MNSWNIIYGDGVDKDMANIDGSIRPQVISAMRKVSQNPLPKREGGYGTELGNRNGLDLTGCLKIKLEKGGNSNHLYIATHRARYENYHYWHTCGSRCISKGSKAFGTIIGSISPTKIPYTITKIHQKKRAAPRKE